MVLVPSPGGPRVENWAAARDGSHIIGNTRARLLVYDYLPSISEHFTWQTLIDHGGRLLELLQELLAQETVTSPNQQTLLKWLTYVL